MRMMSRTPSLQPGMQFLVQCKQSDLDVGSSHTGLTTKRCLLHWTRHACPSRGYRGAVIVTGRGGRSGDSRQPRSFSAAPPQPARGWQQWPWKSLSLMEGWPRRREERYAYGPPGPVLGTKHLRRRKEAYNSEHGVLAREAKLWKQ